jgi:hypothetical protein
MEKRPAIDVALDVFRQPSLARRLLRAPLPEGMLDVIQIAAGKSSNTVHEADLKKRRIAAIFFLQQVLVSGANDNYRQLGLNPGASLDLVREHRRWLLKWLHPDLNHNKWESTLFGKVNSAAAALELRMSQINQPIIALSKSNSRRSRPKAHQALRTRRKLSKWKVILYLGKRFAVIAIACLVGYLGLSKTALNWQTETLASFTPDQRNKEFSKSNDQ